MKAKTFGADNVVVGLDLGTTKIAVVIAELGPGGQVRVIGVGSSPSEGLRRGVVIDVEKTVQAVRRAIEAAELMAGVQAGYSDGVAKTPFMANVDVTECNGCTLCYAACNVAAISAVTGQLGSHAFIDMAQCLGCGACVPACPREAVSLVERVDRPLPPEKRKDMFAAILKEKGRLTPYLVSGAKKRARRLLQRRKG